MGELASEILQAARFPLRHPGFALASVLVLGAGVGTSGTVFGVLHALTMKPLAYADASRVCLLRGWDEARNEEGFSLPLAAVVLLGREAPSLERVAAYRYWSAGLSGDGRPERVQAYRVTGETFPLLGVQPLLGRTLGPDDARAGAPPVAVLGHGLWQRRFGADASAIGRTLRLDGEPHTVVGVMPPSFEFPVFNFKGEVWTPLVVDEAAVLARPGESGSVVAIGRLRQGASARSADVEARSAFLRRAAEAPATFRDLGVRALPFQELGAREARPPLLALLGAVLAVLAQASANLAGLLLARGVGRERELAVRVALGASPRGLLRLLAAESLALAAGGAALGLALAHAALSALHGALPGSMLTTLPNVSELRLTPATAAFVVALALATGLASGVFPALRAARQARASSLSSGARSLGTRGAQRLRGALVTAQVAVSVVLLVGAGLALRSFRGLVARDPGFAPAHVLTFSVSLAESRYPDPGRRLLFFETARARLAALPGVDGAAAVNVLPFSTYDGGTRVLAEGAPEPEPGAAPPAAYRAATPGYFEVMGIPVRRGRALDERDREGKPPVVVVNERLARREFGDADPVGRRLRVGPRGTPWREIVGVVGDVRHWSLSEDPGPEVYVPVAQAPEGRMMFAVRARGRPMDLAGAVRASFLGLDPEQPVFHVAALDRTVEESMLLPAAAASLVTGFGASALLLSAVGLFGLMSFVVAQRTPELGLRMAVGASPGEVLRHVLGDGLRLVAAGAAVGGGLAVLLTTALRGLFFGVSPLDPWAYAATAALLAATALFAAGVPAVRAARLDPARALRVE